jgi:hypothetical protein
MKQYESLMSGPSSEPTGIPPGEFEAALATTPPQAEPSIEQQLQNAREDFAAMKALTESGAAEIARLTAELADEKAVVDVLRSELQDRLQKQRAAEAEVKEVRKDAWQPIGTAPKDGTEILLGYGGRVRPYGNGDYGDRAYVTARKFKPTQWGEGWGVEPFETPTHWRPLPAAPEAPKP